MRSRPSTNCPHADRLARLPGPAAVDDLGLVEPVDGLGQGVVVAVAGAAHRSLARPAALAGVRSGGGVGDVKRQKPQSNQRSGVSGGTSRGVQRRPATASHLVYPASCRDQLRMTARDQRREARAGRPLAFPTAAGASGDHAALVSVVEEPPDTVHRAARSAVPFRLMPGLPESRAVTSRIVATSSDAPEPKRRIVASTAAAVAPLGRCV